MLTFQSLLLLLTFVLHSAVERSSEKKSECLNKTIDWLVRKHLVIAHKNWKSKTGRKRKRKTHTLEQEEHKASEVIPYVEGNWNSSCKSVQKIWNLHDYETSHSIGSLEDTLSLDWQLVGRDSPNPTHALGLRTRFLALQGLHFPRQSSFHPNTFGSGQNTERGLNQINQLKPTSSNCYTMPCRPNLPFSISDIRALWRPFLQVGRCLHIVALLYTAG